MKSKNIIITLSFSIITLSLFGGDSVSAVSYQHSVGLNFTFNSSLSISVSDDLLVDNLTPGDSSDSNIITVGVDTNAVAGYILSSTVGTKTGANTSLANTASSSYKFTNLATTPGTAASLSAFSDNTWGYSYCPDTETNCSSSGSATWISGSIGENGAAGSSVAGYAGLPLDNNDDTSELGNGGVTLINTTDPSTSLNSVQFKIGARASSTQPAGTYTNTINFYAVSYAAPVTLYDAYYAAGKTMLNGYYKLQDMNSSICSAVDVEDDQLQVIDARDNKVYWIAKLKDGHCWMTQDLKLDLDSNTTLTHADTDLGWGSDTATTSWTPANSTIQLNSDGKTFPSMGTATTDNNVPKSANLGDWYYAGYSGTGDVLPSTTVNYLTTTNTTYFNKTPYTINGEHGHIGNYYNWSAAVASNDTSGYTTSSDPQNSICPAKWRLPSRSSPNDEFWVLNGKYNNYLTNTSKGLESSPLFFNRNGRINGGSLGESGNHAYYWSSKINNANVSFASDLQFYDTGAFTNGTGSYRYRGNTVRCIAR